MEIYGVDLNVVKFNGDPEFHFTKVFGEEMKTVTLPNGKNVTLDYIEGYDKLCLGYTQSYPWMFSNWKESDVKQSDVEEAIVILLKDYGFDEASIRETINYMIVDLGDYESEND